jgi:hypothetical protein
MSVADLTRQDVIKMNIACAYGLPGIKALDPEAVASRCDEIARRVAEVTNPQTFEANRAKWNGSFAIFRVHALTSVLQREFGFRYHPAKRNPHDPFTVADTFVHGILWGDGGTCASLPVLLLGVGRRLGYPLKLVSAVAGRGTIGHLFCRWDDPSGERFNIETTADGLCLRTDDYYRTGDYAINANEEKHAGLLKSLSPREELSNFLAERGCCWLDLKSYPDATTCFSWAYALQPANKAKKNRLVGTLDEWGERLLKLRPPGFPEMLFYWPPRMMPKEFPVEMERDLIVMNARHTVLTDEEHEKKWWRPLREGRANVDAPRVIEVRGDPGNFHFTLRFKAPPTGRCEWTREAERGLGDHRFN